MVKHLTLLFVVGVVCFTGSVTLNAAGPMYIKGDANGDGIVSISDAVYISNYLFLAGNEPQCMAAADGNDDGQINVADPITILIDVCKGEDTLDESISGSQGCGNALCSSVKLDSGIAVRFDEVQHLDENIHVPVTVRGKTGILRAWTFTVSFPSETLELVEFLVPGYDGQNAMLVENLEIEPGLRKLSVLYNFFPGESLPVEDGTKIADLVFRDKREVKSIETVLIESSSVFGESELVFSSGEAVFPFLCPLRMVLVNENNMPERPASLAAAEDDDHVTLTWTNPEAYASILIEKYGTGEPEIIILPGDATSYEDTPVSGEFGYCVRGDKSGIVSPAAFAFVSRFSIPSPYNTGFVLNTDASRQLTWENGADYDSILLYRNGLLLATLEDTAVSFTDSDPASLLSVYYLCGIIGGNRSERIPVIPDLSNVIDTENGVENLSFIFRESGEILLSWDPQEQADHYRIERGSEEIAVLPAAETSCVDAPNLTDFPGTYLVSTLSGDEVIGWSLCRIGEKNTFPAVQPKYLDTEGKIEFTWNMRSGLLSILIYCDGEQVAALPGDAERFEYQFSASGDSPTVEFTFLGIGEDYYTVPRVRIITNPLLASALFLRGDANSDGTVSLSDAILIRRYLFLGQTAPLCMDAADPNDDGGVNIADCVSIIAHLFDDVLSLFPEPYPIPGVDLTCDALICQDGTITPGEVTNDLLEIGEAEAGAGEDVLVPVYLTHNTPIEGFQIVASYDPDMFTPYDHDPVQHNGLVFENSIMKELYPDSEIAFSDIYINEEEGYMVIGAFQSFAEDLPIPPGEGHLLVEIKGRVADTAEPGDVISIQPINGLNGSEDGVGLHRLKNEITLTGEARYVSFYPATKGGKIRVMDNPITMDFIRGDANTDGSVDISDAVHTLDYLFNNGEKPLCADAADTNDDGTLNIADAVAVLYYLFVGNTAKGSDDVQLGICLPDETGDVFTGCEYEFCP